MAGQIGNFLATRRRCIIGRAEQGLLPFQEGANLKGEALSIRGAAIARTLTASPDVEVGHILMATTIANFTVESRKRGKRKNRRLRLKEKTNLLSGAAFGGPFAAKTTASIHV